MRENTTHKKRLEEIRQNFLFSPLKTFGFQKNPTSSLFIIILVVNVYNATMSKVFHWNRGSTMAVYKQRKENLLALKGLQSQAYFNIYEYLFLQVFARDTFIALM